MTCHGLFFFKKKKEKSQRELDKLLEVGSCRFSPLFFPPNQQTGRSERVMTQFGREEKNKRFERQNIECVLLDGRGIWVSLSLGLVMWAFNAAGTFYLQYV